MEDNLDSVEVEALSDTWNKVLRDCKQIGFREGAFDGQEENFQKSFDIGYENGFKNGFQLGKYKGNLMYLYNRVSDTNKAANKNLNDTRKAICIICEDSKLLDSSTIKEIIEFQDAKMENAEKEMKA